MIKFLNNITYELIGLGIFLVLGTFHFFTELGGAITGIVLTIVGIYYLTKMVVSFRHWKISKGASLINAHINFMLFATISGTGFILLYLPGSTELIHSCLVLPQYTIVIFGIVMLIRRQKFNIYWELIRTNTMKWALSIVLCLILFYMFDMPTHLLEQGGPSHGWIKLY